jgi:threonylcarbamoyladenosine tRNA methylthiotransferase MtaB
MPQVPVAVRRERAARLRALGERRLEAFLAAQLGKRVRGLVEQGGRGHTDQYAPFRLAGEPLPAGRVVELAIERAEAGALLGRPT